jgi:hypothetical protein
MRSVLRKAWGSALFLVLCVFGLAGVVMATTVILPADDDMIISARAIIRAKVLSVTCGLDSQQTHVYTYTTLRVNEIIKGQIGWRDITIKEMGGHLADRGTTVFGSPQFTPGEAVVLFLDTWADGSLRVHQMFLGKFSIVKDPNTGEMVASRGIADQGASLMPQSSGQPVTNRMALKPFLKMLRSRLSANLDRASEYEARYYTNVPLLQQPAEYDKKAASGVAASGTIQPEFHLFNPPARWFQPDTNQPVTVLTNPDQEPNPQTPNDVAAAMQAWSTVAGCSLRVTTGGSTSTCQTTGSIVADFNNCLGFFSGGGCQNILAEGGFDYGSAQKVVNGTTFYQISAGFISFNPFASCFFGDHCNVQEITTHEMGHSLGLHHSWDPIFGGSPTAVEQNATMYYIAHFDGRCASVHTDDMNGIKFVYPGTSAPVRKAYCDFDGDGKSDVSIWRGTTGVWWVMNSSTQQFTSKGWGLPGVGDIPVPGDYDGDGKTDIAIYRASTGTWWIINSHDGSITSKGWGLPGVGDVPVPGDYDGDGKTDIAIYRASTGTWWIINSHDGSITTKGWGLPNMGDVAVPGDYDGDGKTDVAIWRGSTGDWWIVDSSTGNFTRTTLGLASAGDQPVVGDYDGDGKNDLAIWNGNTGMWHILRSSDGGTTTATLGSASSGDVPSPGDYDGDGKTDVAVWRASTGMWFVINSSTGMTVTTSWGLPNKGDVPVPSAVK